MHSVKTVDRALRGLLAVMLVLFVGAVAKAVYDPPPHVVVAGERAPEFTVSTDNGRTVSVPKFDGKLLVLNFWATWCPPCIQETPSLSQFARDYAPKGVVVLGISVDASEKAYSAFLQKYKPQFLTARDANIHRDYGTFMYPETYIIDSSGKVVQKIAEGADWSSPNVRSFFDSQL
jgi:cytochrome c biogenesis protein CcmG, thiol:disulfide interchange protein DsbE